MRALIAKFLSLWSRCLGQHGTQPGPGLLRTGALLGALALGLAASLAVAGAEGAESTGTQASTGTDTQSATGSDTQTTATDTPSDRSSDSRSGQGTASGSRYIVVYRDSVSDPQQKTAQLEREGGFKSDYKYSRALKGFAA